MHPFDEMKTWVGFTETDAARLRTLHPVAAPRLAELSEVFYGRILANEDARRVFVDDQQVERLKKTLQAWAAELLLGPHDLAYYERRQRIGQRHVEVGLASRYMFLAMSVYRERLCDIAHQNFGLEEGHDLCESIGKICDLDLAIMTSTYVRGREVRQLETLQEIVVSHLQTTAIVLDERGRVVAATPTAAPLLSVDDPMGLAWEAAFNQTFLQAQSIGHIIGEAIEGRTTTALPRVGLKSDLGERHYRVWIVPLAHAHARVLVQVDDITDSINAEARAIRAESLAQIGALSAAVAHELRNPLAGISGAIQVIARTMPADDRRKPIMEKVEQQVRRLDALVNDLLAFARPTTPDLGRVDLADAGRIVADLVSREAPTCRLSVEGAGVARADSQLVQQILLNLVQNAVQAQEGNGLVMLRVGPAHVDVADDGPGVAESEREKIFAPFFTTRAKGTGLGLAICRKYAQAMGGSVEVVPGPLKGACFRLSLGEAS